jgi:hypothetical protein
VLSKLERLGLGGALRCLRALLLICNGTVYRYEYDIYICKNDDNDRSYPALREAIYKGNRSGDYPEQA